MYENINRYLNGRVPPSATASIGEKSKVLVEAGHVAPRAEKRKVALEAYKTRVAREGIKNLPGCCGTTAALEPGYGCRSVRWLSPLDQRLSEICQNIRFMPKIRHGSTRTSSRIYNQFRHGSTRTSSETLNVYIMKCHPSTILCTTRFPPRETLTFSRARKRRRAA